jgi:LacI family transcriptional regulator
MSERRRVLFLPAWNVHALHEGVVAYAHEANWILDNQMCYSGELPSHAAKVDGVICRHAFRKDFIDFVRELGLPTVAFEQSEALPVPRVTYNEAEIGRCAARHLLARGYKSLAFYHRGWTSSQRPRMEGFCAEAEAAGVEFVMLEPMEQPLYGKDDAFTWEWLDQQLGAIRNPVGVMAINDLVAGPLVDALLDFGYSVPEQIAVVSAENDPMLCDVASVPISSVESCTHRMGYEAARLLDRLMDGEAPPAEPILIDPGEVHTRASTDTVAIHNLHAARALRFAWTHYREPITVDSVSAHVSVTRRRLQTLFHDHVGRTMQEEIVRVRLADACRRLKETSMRIHEIASTVGFSSSLHLHRSFQSAFGMGPKAFRETGEVPDFGVLPAQAGGQPSVG